MHSNLEFIQFLYRLMLRRDADPDGISHWTGELDRGGTPDEIFAAIWNSEEFRHLPSNPYLLKPVASAVYFFHIPKTAGISVHRFLETSYGSGSVCPVWGWDELVATPLHEINRYNVFRGHFQGYLADYLARPLTVLRDPIERTISCYSYARGNPNYPFHKQAMELTLKQYCLHPSTRWRIEDYQTACLLTSLWRTNNSFADDCSSFSGPDYSMHRAMEATTANAVPPEVRFELAKVALTKSLQSALRSNCLKRLTCFPAPSVCHM